jgi:membrane associated rhomboid family serine protease
MNDASPWLDEGHARLYSLLMEARSIPFHLERTAGGWLLLVPAEQYLLARKELALLEEANRAWPPVEPPARPLVENTLATLSVLLLLAIFHNVTLLSAFPSGLPLPDWRALGSADSALILQGQWWRLVTALTLHADWLHLSGNLAIGGMFILLLCRDLGAGPAWGLILASGILGNLANALLQPLNHNAIGASTAIFGAVGILAASSFVRHRQRLQRRRILPVAAALALLAILGTEGANTDLGAHLFGFLWGIVLGFAAESLLERSGPLSRAFSALLALASALVVVGAWWLALLPVG